MTKLPDHNQQRDHDGERSQLAAQAIRLGYFDVVGICALALTLFLLSYLQSRHRIYWADEIMGRYVLDAGSWQVSLQRWNAGIDSSGYWFYVFAKPWELLFGRSENALRMFSAAGVATAAALIWITARRFYSFTAVAIAVPFIFLDINVLRWQLSNGRCYGVFLASAAWVILLLFQGEFSEHLRPSFLCATFLAYNILTGSHTLGVLYAGALLALQLSLDVYSKRRRVSLYTSAALGILVAVSLSVGNIRATTALGKPAFWTVRPLLRELVFSGETTSSPVRVAVVALALLTLLQFRRMQRRSPVYIVLTGFFVLDILFFLISRVGTSIYVDRYLTPFAFALILFCAELLTQLREIDPSSALTTALVPALIVAWGLIEMPRLYINDYLQPDYTAPLLAALPISLPVIDTDVASFVEIEFYNHLHLEQPFIFPLDREVTADPRNKGGVSGFHEMENFARLGLDMPDLQPTEAILSRYPEFLVITAKEPTAWVRKRLLDEPGRYVVTDLGSLPSSLGLHLWHAHRIESPLFPLR